MRQPIVKNGETKITLKWKNFAGCVQCRWPGNPGSGRRIRRRKGAMKGDRKRKNLITRREMIGATSLGTFGAAMLSSSEIRAQEQQTYQVGKDPGKHEPIPDFKFDLETAKGWNGEGGSAKEATVAE